MQTRWVATDATSGLTTTHPHPKIPASTPAIRVHGRLLSAYAEGGSTYRSQVPRPR